MKEKNKLRIRVMAATLAALFVVTPVVTQARLRAWGTPIGSGTIHMTHNSTCAELYHSGNPEGTSNCNAKAVVKDGKWIPVYCVEKGKYLNDTDYLSASMYTNSDWCSQYSMTARDAIGMIYVCGYNGSNGWGELQESIFNHDAEDSALMANSNYHKYIATQALIWEVLTGNTYASRNSSVQNAMNELRGRVRNYMNKESRAANTTGSISVYRSEADAKTHPNMQTSISGGVGHFSYGYGYYNPTNASDVAGPIANRTPSDFTMSVQNEIAVMRWTRVYGSSADSGQGGETIYRLDDNNADALWGVVLWSPDNGNQLTISATASIDSVYAAFRFQYEQIEYQAAATLNTVKVDDKGNPARGATFTVYDSSGSVIGSMADPNRNGQYSFALSATQFGDEGRFYYDADENGNAITSVISRTYTVKETSPATEVYVNGQWQSASFATNGTTYSIAISIARDTGKMTWTATGTSGGSATRSANQTVGTITFGDTNQNGKILNDVYVSGNAGFSILKVDDQGRSARNAEFTIYSNAECSNAVGTMTDSENNGHYSLSGITFARTARSSTKAQSQVFYIKETKPATEIRYGKEWLEINCKEDGTVKKVIITWIPSTGAIEAALEENGRTVQKIAGTYNERTFTSSVQADFSESPVVNEIVSTGSVRIEKFDALNGERLTGASFRVYIDADANEVLSEDDSIYCEVLSDENGDGVYLLEDMPLDKSYLVQEMEAPEFYETDPNIYAFTLTPKNRDVVVDNMSWDVTEGTQGEFLNLNPIVGTSLVDKKTEEHLTVIDKEVTLVDTVSYHGLHVGESYVMTGTLYDKESGKPVEDENGVVITSSVTFVPDSVDGTVEVEFTLNTEVLRSKTLVAAEKVRHEESERWVGIHFDLEDESQSVYVPDIHTTLQDQDTSEHVAPVSENITLVDTVLYENLLPGKKYSVTGVLVNKDTNKLLDDEDGNTIMETVDFVPEKSSGSVEVIFTFDSSLLQKTTIVAFETLTCDEITVATHADINDLDQTVDIPDIHTTFYDRDLSLDPDMRNMTRGNTTVTLVDTVTYENLTPNLEYKVTGTIIIKETGEALKDRDGNAVVASTVFKPEKESGMVDVLFSVDTTELTGMHLVAFETLEYNGITLVVHADLENGDQTVQVPRLATTATVEGQKAFFPNESITLKDTVAYENLIPGKTYELRGQIMKNTGEPFAPQAQAIVSVARFTPDAADGTIDMTFTFFGKALKADDELVVFEDMYLVETINENGKVEERIIKIGSHADVNDKGQTVSVKPWIPSTGETSGSGKSIAIGIFAICIGGAIAFVVIKKKKDE